MAFIEGQSLDRQIEAGPVKLDEALDIARQTAEGFKPFWEKPPMFFWMQSTGMKLFGVTEFAARLPNAICGIATLLIIFLCGRKLYNARFGLLWALAFGGSLFPNMYFKSGIIDPWFNLFIFLAVYFLILYHWKRNEFDYTDLPKKQST
jgi:4-amino-4-deoxy-L-arabinose transferase-like glycosyltransferase